MAQQNVRKSEYFDLPNIPETYADYVIQTYFDNRSQNFRLEFGVTRLDATDPKQPIAKQYTSCRLVLTPDALIKLAANIEDMMNDLKAKGIVTPHTHDVSDTVQ